jgi:hypothetical protein
MRSVQRMSARLGTAIVVFLLLALAGASIAWVAEGSGLGATAAAKEKIEATIFSYDGKDFVRSKTTMMTEAGKSAVNTKLDHDSPAYKALTEKHSYTGDATIFGKKYDADYAPLTDQDGKVTGALFVGVAE